MFAWQGWQLPLPEKWNPVRLEGDYSQGYALFADLNRPRLGVRWKRTGGRKFRPDRWARKALLDEVGLLAADEARPLPLGDKPFEASTLYIEPEPPGRDVWVGCSRASQRGIELIYRTRRREHALAGLVPMLEDQPADRPMNWSVFDLSCVSPAGMKLESQQLNAGDLALTFAAGKRAITVRQIALAKLALARMPLEKWLNEQQRRSKRFFRTRGKPEPVEMQAGGRALNGIRRPMRRRWRYFWRFTLPRGWQSVALVDEQRDRLLIVQSTDETLIGPMLDSIGWAK